MESFKKQLEETENLRTLTHTTKYKNYYEQIFKPLLKLGQNAEQLALKRLLNYYKYETPKIKFNNNNKYDIKLNKIKYEIKCDVRATKTQNIFIEYKAYGKASGIETTRAKFYLIIVPFEIEPIYLLLKVKQIKKLIEEKIYFKNIEPNKLITTGGYLFKLDILKEYGILI